jgi:hypothetical protein
MEMEIMHGGGTMKTIYIATTGEYSDYHIVGVFDTLQLVQEFQSLYGCDNIEEYTVNKFSPQYRDGMIEYLVEMAYDGTVLSVKPRMRDPDESLEYMVRWKYDSETGDSRPRSLEEKTLNKFVIATSTEHAIKIVNERRVQLIAFEQWK